MSAIRIETDLGAPMRDGVVLRADLWTAEGSGPRPIILLRTPYLKEYSIWPAFLDVRMAIARGYAVVAQDVRGRGTSGGEWEPFVHEKADGADTVEWLARQPWCDGRVVMTGMSYQGLTQWAAAAARPPALRAIAPVMSCRAWGEGALMSSGVPEAGMIGTWVAANLAAPEDRWMTDLDRAYTDRAGLGEIAPYASAWFEHPADDPYWTVERNVVEHPDVPVLAVGGWYDFLLRGTLESWARHRGPRDRLLIGPWGHVVAPSNLVGDRDLGFEGSMPASRTLEAILDFFDAALEGTEPTGPVARTYTLGARRWSQWGEWPPRERSPLVLDVPLAGAFAVDPAELPEFRGGRSLLIERPHFGIGPLDNRTLAERKDVLAATVPWTGAGRRIAGSVALELQIGTDGAGDERQWAAMLCRSSSDGRWDAIVDGVAVAPAVAEHVVVPLGDVDLLLGEEEDLVVLVAGGWYPRWAPPASPAVQRVAGARLHVDTVDARAGMG